MRRAWSLAVAEDEERLALFAAGGRVREAGEGEVAGIRRRHAERELRRLAQVQQAIEQMDPDDVPAYLDRVRQHEAQQVQQQAHLARVHARITNPEEAARAALKDHDVVIDK